LRYFRGGRTGGGHLIIPDRTSQLSHLLTVEEKGEPLQQVLDITLDTWSAVS
jgi:hypothetical protein